MAPRNSGITAVIKQAILPMGLNGLTGYFCLEMDMRITIRLSDRQILAFLEWSIGDCCLLDRTHSCCAGDCCLVKELV